MLPGMSLNPPVTPKATGSCFQMMVMPIAASMPLMTAEGTSALKRPSCSTPRPNCSTPASTTAVRNGGIPPRRSTSASTMAVRPAAGPVTDSGERLIHGTTRPPAIPAMSPETGGTPHAIGDAETQRKRNQEDDDAGDGVFLRMTEHRRVVLHGEPSTSRNRGDPPGEPWRRTRTRRRSRTRIAVRAPGRRKAG